MEKPRGKYRRHKNKDDENEQDIDFIPETGLCNEDGFLFYHCNPKALTKAQLARVAKHGVNLNTSSQSTLEESIRIVENWRKFAEENRIKFEKAPEYLSATWRTGEHLMRHQHEHNFWPKLCAGLPHLTANRVMKRAATIMTADFIKDLNWQDPGPQIQEQYFVADTWTDVEMQKARELMERGCSMQFIAEKMEMSEQRTAGLLNKLRSLKNRSDPDMMFSFFQSAVDFGLDIEAIRAKVETGSEENLLAVADKVNFNHLSLSAKLSVTKCREFLKGILVQIRERFLAAIEKGDDKETAFESAMQLVSAKPPLTEKQLLQALELTCLTIGKTDTAKDLLKNKELAKLIKNNGITGFSCYMPEYRFLHFKLTYLYMKSLKKHVFFHLRRQFSFRAQLHCLYWGWMRIAIWDHLPRNKGESAYAAVIRHESTNPFRSKLTMRFLENHRVADWFLEDHLRKRPASALKKRDAQLEAFILYCNLKFGDQFVFPAKLRKYLTEPSATVESLLKENLEGDQDNSEYLSTKKAEKRLKKATETENLVKSFRNKSAVVKIKEEDDDSDDEKMDESPDQLIRDLEDIKFSKAEALDQRRREIAEFVKNADLQHANIRKGAKYKNQLYSSNAFVSDSDSESDDEKRKEYEKPTNSEESEGEEEDAPTGMDVDSEATEDVRENIANSTNSKRRRRMRNDEDSDNVDASENTKKSKKRRLLADLELNEKKERRRSDSNTEDVIEKSESHRKKRKHKLSEEPVEDVEDAEAERRRRKKEKKAEKRREREEEESAPVEAPEDVAESEEERRRRRKERKAEKKRKREEQEASEGAPENVEDPDDASKNLKKLKKKKKGVEQEISTDGF